MEVKSLIIFRAVTMPLKFVQQIKSCCIYTFTINNSTAVIEGVVFGVFVACFILNTSIYNR